MACHLPEVGSGALVLSHLPAKQAQATIGTAPLGFQLGVARFCLNEIFVKRHGGREQAAFANQRSPPPSGARRSRCRRGIPPRPFRLERSDTRPVRGLPAPAGAADPPPAGACSAAGLFVQGPHRQRRGNDRSAHQRQRDAAGQRRDRRITPAPAHGPLGASDRPGQDRLAREKPPQILGQSRRAGVSLLRLLGQTLQANRLQVARNLGHQATTAAPALASGPAPRCRARSGRGKAAGPSRPRRESRRAHRRPPPDRPRPPGSHCSGAM